APAFGAGDCQSHGGISFKGSGTTCQTVACCPPLPPDHDLDGDVDLADFGWLQQCLPSVPTMPSSLGCSCADFNADSRIDAGDVKIFLNCLSGADVPANAGCMN